nr:LysR substrate-binding domain-containing protein [Microbacterium bovistercoris]
MPKKPAAEKTPRKNPPTPGPLPAGPFRLGAVPGATPGKWIRIWEERMPRNPLELIPLTAAAQRDAIGSGEVDAALVRLPIDRAGRHVIALYDEVPVVVVPAESDLTAADELEAADLAGEVLITPADDVLGFTASGTREPSFAAPETTEDAVATVGAGVGVVIVPMSLARLHHRKDVTYRPLRGGPISTVALVWDADRPSDLIDAFVGIVRGRTANSSR